MKTKSYHNYKPSGIEWLGAIPEHWNIVSIKWITTIYSGGTPDKSNYEFWTDGTIPWLNSGAVNDEYILEPSEYITEDAFKNSSAKWIPKDALVIALAGQGKTKGMVAQLGFRTTCNQSMAALIPDSLISSRFLFWWLNRNYITLRNLAGGEARDGLNLEIIGSMPCPLCPIPEQQVISTFLDLEAGKIDALIEKKKRLIELLKEKRTSLISRAVTKGLDPSVKMKPSGVEWLGEVPEHWDIKRLGYTTYVKGRIGWQGLTVDEFVDDGPYCVTGTDFTNGRIKWETCYHVSEDRYSEDPYIQLRENDLLITKDGTIGKTAIVADLVGKTTLNSGIFLTRSYCNSYSTYYMYWLLNSKTFSDFIEFNKTGTTISHLYQNVFVRFLFPLPSLTEQQAIATFLDSETGKIDGLIDRVEDVIKRLLEYRQALINAAVTGKIDLREES